MFITYKVKQTGHFTDIDFSRAIVPFAN